MLADTAAIAVLVSRPQSTIRNWASNGWLTRRGTGPRNRALYDIDEAQQLAARLAHAQLDNHRHQDGHSDHAGRSVPADGP
jgi:hypothetical protein